MDAERLERADCLELDREQERARMPDHAVERELGAHDHFVEAILRSEEGDRRWSLI